MARSMTVRKNSANAAEKTENTINIEVNEAPAENTKTREEKQENEADTVATTTSPVSTTQTQPQKKKFKPDDGILCRSVTVGGLWLDGIKSGNVYRWVEYGDETEVEYRDLVSMIRSRSNYIFNPTFVIEDEDFIEEFSQLKKFYKEQYTIADLKSVLKLPVDSMIKTIQNLPAGAQSSLKNIASTAIANGSLDSVRKIKALDNIFDTELSLLASLFQ